jgi:hypothetical protein
LVFVDGRSTNVALLPRYARAPKGRRNYGKAPGDWGRNVTFISSIPLAGIGAASMTIEGSADGESFSLYRKAVLHCPTLKRGQIMVMDNLSVHKSIRVSDLVEQRGCELW